MIIVAHERGNCSAYNAGLQTALAAISPISGLLVIDDDETRRSGMAGAMCAAAETLGPDIVGGPQMPIFPKQRLPAGLGHPVFAPPYAQSGPVRALYSSGNLLIGRDVLASDGTALPRPAIQLHGRRRCRFPEPRGGNGLRLAWCAEAVIRETVPTRRLEARLDRARIDAQRRDLDAGRKEEARRATARQSARVRQEPGAAGASPFRGAAEARQDRVAVDCPLSRSISRSAACLRNSAIRMSSTGSLRKTDRGSIAGAFSPSAWRPSPGRASCSPSSSSRFDRSSPAAPRLSSEGGGDIVNQLGFSMLGAAGDVRDLTAFVDRGDLAALFSPWWLLLLGCLDAFGAACVRSVGGEPVRLLHRDRHRGHGGILALPRDADSFSSALAFAGTHRRRRSAISGLSSIPPSPTTPPTRSSRNMPDSGAVSSQHKNLAGPVMACFSFAELYLNRRGWKWIGALLFATALFFMAIGHEEQRGCKQQRANPLPAAAVEIETAEAEAGHHRSRKVLVLENTTPEAGVLRLERVGGVLGDIRIDHKSDIAQ